MHGSVMNPEEIKLVVSLNNPKYVFQRLKANRDSLMRFQAPSCLVIRQFCLSIFNNCRRNRKGIKWTKLTSQETVFSSNELFLWCKRWYSMTPVAFSPGGGGTRQLSFTFWTAVLLICTRSRASPSAPASPVPAIRAHKTRKGNDYAFLWKQRYLLIATR